MQLYHGVSRSAVPSPEVDRIERALKGIATYGLTQDVAAQAGRIEGELVARSEAIDPADVILGSTALARNGSVVTRNARPFSRIDGLRLVGYQGIPEPAARSRSDEDPRGCGSHVARLTRGFSWRTRT